MAMKRGLPERASMRHDAHFVEELTRRSGMSLISSVSVTVVRDFPITVEIRSCV